MDEHELLLRIGQAIRARRSQLGFSQEAFADSIGMHRAYYGRIERGGTNLTVGTVGRVTTGVRLSISELFTSVESQFREGSPTCY